jgi:hypothetical protein
VNALALCFLALQGGQLEVTSATDRSRVGVGEEVTYTLTATGRSTAAFRAELPTLNGLALLERRERTDVAYGARVPSRTYTLQLRLRAEQIGTWTVGPIEVTQGTASGTAAAVTVTVVSGGSAGGGIGPGVQALVQRVPSPGGDGPSILTIASTRSLFVGDQVDVLTAAWLPRALRLRLRQAPTLSPPVLAGVWAAPTAPISGAVASRVVDGDTYDLFVGFQTVYPLTAGMLTIPAARLFWTEPGTRSREERRLQVASAPVTLSVRPLPTGGRPPAFDGPVARDLRIEYRLARSAARAGAVLPVELVVSGEGNLALWPEPIVAWPAGARAYQERVEERLRPSSVRRSGTKAFRFAVVPDSAGTLALPAVEYPYFDPETESYRVARVAPLAIPVVEGDVVGERRTAPLLAAPSGPSIAERVWRLPPAVRLALAVMPLLLLAGGYLGSRRRRIRPAPVLSAEDRLSLLVHSLRPVAGALDPPALIAALRQRGVDRETAEQLVAMHRALESERYGPSGSGGVPASMAKRLESTLAVLPSRLWIRGLGAGILLLLGGIGHREGTAQDANTLYREGRYPQAAEAFRAAARSTTAPAVWYNLAAAEFMARRDAHAAAALLAASTRIPRGTHVAALWTQLGRAREPLRRARSGLPVTLEEVVFAGLVALWLGAPLAAFGRRRLRALGWGILTVAAIAGLAAMALHRDRAEPRAVIAQGAPLRVSPHGLAPEQGSVPAFVVVRLEHHRPGWWLVRTRDGARGWVPDDAVAPVPRLD